MESRSLPRQTSPNSPENNQCTRITFYIYKVLLYKDVDKTNLGLWYFLSLSVVGRFLKKIPELLSVDLGIQRIRDGQ